MSHSMPKKEFREHFVCQFKCDKRDYEKQNKMGDREEH